MSTVHRLSGGLIAAMAVLTAVAPFSTDLYLPAFPDMMVELGVGETGVQLTLTAFLIGIGVGQLVFGPLSDRFGRRAPLLVGTVLCVVASAAAALAPGIELLVAARFVQGAAGAAGMVIVRAIIADLASGRSTARAYSLNMAVAGVAPIVAPVAGGLLTAPLGWRGILTVVFVLTVVMLVIVVAVVPETHPREKRMRLRHEAAEAGGALRDLRSRGFVGHALVSCFCFAALLGYVSASPFLYQTMMGFSPSQYGFAFGVNSVALVGATVVSARAVSRWEVRSVIAVGLGLMTVAVTSIAVVVVSGAPFILVAVALVVMLAGFGLTQGNSVALAITSVPRASGSASALIGAGQFGLGAVTSASVGVAGAASAVPLMVILGISLVAAWCGYAVGRPLRPTLHEFGPR